MQKFCSGGVRRLATFGDTAAATRATTAAAALPSLLSSTRCLTTAASSSPLSRGAAAHRALRNSSTGRQERARRGSRGVSSQQHPRGKQGDLPLRADASPAAAAFHAFLRQQNSPYVSTLTAAAAADSNDAYTTGHVPQQALVDAERLSVVSDGSAHLLSDAGAMDNAVLREWRVGPPTPPSPSSSAASPQAGKQPSSGQQNPRASSPHNEELRRHDAIEQARRHTTRQLSERHRHIYERDVLHAYQLLKNVEGAMFHWSRQRRRRGQSEEAAGGAAGDVDVVEGRCFEYAGQIQRTLHQLTPAHFDGMRDYRLRRSTRGSTAPRGPSSSSSSSSPPLPLLHLRLLWRLLHVTELFYAIGRQASLPRSVVQSYVRSANCAYGIREVLRVLGDGVVTAASGLSTTNPSTAAPTRLSRDELFQMFYAVLCIPAEDAPGVPIYDPALLVQEYGAAAPQLRFQIDCVATGATAARMPLDEWCVRWWCHCYEEHHSANAADRSSSSSSGASSEMSAVLSMGQAMDVIRAALYATRSANAAAPTASSSMPASSQSFSVVVSPFSYFETPPRGVEKTALRRGSSTRPGDSGGDEHSPHAGPQSEQQRRSRPHLVGALGGDRTALRIPYHLGQRFVTAFLRHLLASATTRGNGSGEAGDAAVVEAAMLQLLRRPDRDAVRDVALLCTAILYFEVFSAQTATFMARAAPLCREQVELLSGHEISCVLLAYATLQRWEGSVEGGSDAVHKGGAGRGERRGPAATPVRVRSASTVAAAATAAASDRSRDGAGESAKANVNPASATAWVKQEEQQNNFGEERMQNEAPQHTGRPSSAGKTSETQQDGATAADTPTSPWHLFYVTLGTRAGQLSDSLGEEDVTRVLRAMEIVGMEHEDLRRALESSLRMRNLGRRLLYET